jgi:hypothetical protein
MRKAREKRARIISKKRANKKENRKGKAKKGKKT